MHSSAPRGLTRHLLSVRNRLHDPKILDLPRGGSASESDDAVEASEGPAIGAAAAFDQVAGIGVPVKKLGVVENQEVA
jgi:hypothetical protein